MNLLSKVQFWKKDNVGKAMETLSRKGVLPDIMIPSCRVPHYSVVFSVTMLSAACIELGLEKAEYEQVVNIVASMKRSLEIKASMLNSKLAMFDKIAKETIDGV
jgi:hypothetical protein